MIENEHYTLAHFVAATKAIKPLLEAIPDVTGDKITGEPWEITTPGGSPQATTFVGTGDKTSHIAITITLRDCGMKPFAVVRIARYFHPAPPTDWAYAHCQLGVGEIYPHQFAAIPALVAWLKAAPIPTPPDALLQREKEN